jgi:hypothetical protein
LRVFGIRKFRRGALMIIQIVLRLVLRRIGLRNPVQWMFRGHWGHAGTQRSQVCKIRQRGSGLPRRMSVQATRSKHIGRQRWRSREFGWMMIWLKEWGLRMVKIG